MARARIFLAMSEQSLEKSVYELCGADFFIALVDAFYDGIETDHVLMPLYPEGAQTQGARHRLASFLIQYWGGPHTYMEERGHPRLRMRHQPFVIGESERDHWLMHMANAIESTMEMIPEQVREGVVDQLAQYMVNAAEHLRNT
jgi:hemoglobin